jgi:cardiolipin synthase A/B
VRIDLLVDSARFWMCLEADIVKARKRVFVQTFSFEGDGVGARLARSLRRCRAGDRRLLVDGYSLFFQNDRLIPGPALAGRAFRRELRATHGWVRRMREHGVGVRFCNPPRASIPGLLRRNHKKLVVVDDGLVYVGGINFCDHNFEWHDMMLRVEDRALARELAGDFRASWEGRPASWDQTFGPLRVVSLNGRGNAAGFAPVLDLLAEARGRIDVVSPYLSPPFSDHLARAAARGVCVRILTPESNNKPSLARFIEKAARRHGFKLLRYPGRMSHLKAMLVDNETLLVGSSNFDFMSYHVLEELLVMTRDPGTIAAFRQRVWEPDTAQARPGPGEWDAGGFLGHGAVCLGALLAAALEA